MSELSNLNKIDSYLHCKRCVDEVGHIEGESPESYSNYSVGWTEIGLQVWCDRHECNIINLDFEGHQHPSNTSRPAPDKLKSVIQPEIEH